MKLTIKRLDALAGQCANLCRKYSEAPMSAWDIERAAFFRRLHEDLYRLVTSYPEALAEACDTLVEAPPLVFVLMSDSHGSTFSLPKPNGAAVTTLQEALKFKSFSFEDDYDVVVVFETCEAAVKHLKDKLQ